MAQSAVNLYNHNCIIVQVALKLGLSFALPSSIPVFVLQHVDSICFIEEKPLFGGSAVFRDT